MDRSAGEAQRHEVAYARRTFTDAQFPAQPYPGARPDCSFVHHDGLGHPLRFAGGWWVGVQGLDGWLADRGAEPMAHRRSVLSYGSNVCPSKITWLRTELGLPGPVIVLRARTEGLAAVWAAGRRVVDEQRPATLAAVPGAVEQHGVWLATDEQLAVLDACEGRGERYHLARVHTGRVRLEDGSLLPDPLAYVAACAARQPLLVNGAVVRCADVPQQVAGGLEGVPTDGDGLDYEVVRRPPVERTVSSQACASTNEVSVRPSGTGPCTPSRRG